MAVSFPHLAIASGLSLCLSLAIGGAPLEVAGLVKPAWAQTEAPSDAESLTLANQQFEQAVDFLENGTGAIWLMSQSYNNIERNAFYEQMSLGHNYELLGYPTEGLAMIEAAIASPDADNYLANLLADRSALYQQLERYEDAVAAAQKSLEAAHQAQEDYDTHDTYEEAAALYQLGRSYFMLGDIDQAVATLSASQAVLEQTNYPALKAQTLHALSLAYQAQGDAAKATETDALALEIRTEIAESNGWDVTRLDPSTSLERWDQTLLAVKDAISTIQHAISTYQALDQVTAEVNARRYLGNLYRQIGLSTQAREQLDQADARLQPQPAAVDPY